MENILQDIHQYNNMMTISQVVRFFDKNDKHITKSMIQNYVRDGILPPPLNKRYYTHQHLATLILVDYLKNTFDMTAIKNALKPLMDETGISLEIYIGLLSMAETLATHWREHAAPLIFDKNNVNTMSLLLLMVHSTDIRSLTLDYAASNQKK